MAIFFASLLLAIRVYAPNIHPLVSLVSLIHAGFDIPLQDCNLGSRLACHLYNHSGVTRYGHG